MCVPCLPFNTAMAHRISIRNRANEPKTLYIFYENGHKNHSHSYTNTLKPIKGALESYCLRNVFIQKQKTDDFRLTWISDFRLFRIARYICCVYVSLFQHIYRLAFDGFMFMAIDFIASLGQSFSLLVLLKAAHQKNQNHRSWQMFLIWNWIEREEMPQLLGVMMHHWQTIRFVFKIHPTIY